MHFKLIIALVSDDKTEAIIKVAKEAGATGATIISSARGQGLNAKKSFFGLSLESQRDALLFLVEEHLSRHVLEMIEDVGKMDASKGAGIAFQIDVEDAVGVADQIEILADRVEDEL